MKSTLHVFLLLLVPCLPAAAEEGDAPPEKPPTPQTVKTQVKTLLNLTGTGNPVLVNELCFTWGDVFYGGSNLCLLNWWRTYQPDYPREFTSEQGTQSSTEVETHTYAGIGCVLGFNIGRHNFLSAHVELAASAIFQLDPEGGLELYPRITAGPDFNLGGGWRLSAEVDYFIVYIGFGLGLSYSF
jgi:hypothetical protein